MFQVTGNMLEATDQTHNLQNKKNKKNKKNVKEWKFLTHQVYLSWFFPPTVEGQSPYFSHFSAKNWISRRHLGNLASFCLLHACAVVVRTRFTVQFRISAEYNDYKLILTVLASTWCWMHIRNSEKDWCLTSNITYSRAWYMTAFVIMNVKYQVKVNTVKSSLSF